MTKDEALKLAIGKIKSARDCHFAAIDPLLFEAEEILEQALAAPVQELDHGDELTIAYMSGVYRGKELAAQPAPVQPVAWVPYLSDRADGVQGHYAIARWNPRGYREVWNLRRHAWGAFSDDVMSLEEADYLLQQITIPTRKPTPPAAQPAPVQPVWIQPDHLQKAQKAPFLCRVEPHKREDFIPLYTTPPAAQPAVQEPAGYMHELISNGGGVWLGVVGKDAQSICKQSHIDGETSDEIRPFWFAPQPAAQPAPTVQEPVAWPTLPTDEREALERFHETWEDDQGYDVPKPMMKRLAKLGVVYSEGFGRYGMTDFGLAVLQSTQPAASVQKPVKTGDALFRQFMSEADKAGITHWPTPPAAQRQWVRLTDKQMVDAIESLYQNRATAEMAAKVSMDEFRAIEAKLKEKNT